MGGDAIDRANFDVAEIARNPFWCPDREAAARWEKSLDTARKDGSSLGAVIEVVAENVPAGLGDPVYQKLSAKLAEAMMSINAVKAVEIGDGFAAARLRGEENADRMRIHPHPPAGAGPSLSLTEGEGTSEARGEGKTSRLLFLVAFRQSQIRRGIGNFRGFHRLQNHIMFGIENLDIFGFMLA
jgi:hypothetical protein